jgi:hypothetical protein
LRYTLLDYREHFVERCAAAAVDLLGEKLRLLVIDGRCRGRHAVGAVGKLRDFGDEALDGLADDRARHLSAPSLPAVVAKAGATYQKAKGLGVTLRGGRKKWVG